MQGPVKLNLWILGWFLYDTLPEDSKLSNEKEKKDNSIEI